MTETIARFEEILKTTPQRLVDIREHAASAKAGPDRWSKKEILGHLIDSASNNHHRWVRAQFTNPVIFPEYEQNEWVDSQRYATETWPDLVNLWLLFNRHLLHIVKTTPQGVLANELHIGDHPPMTLAKLVGSYLDHMQHHLDQIVLP